MILSCIVIIKRRWKNGNNKKWICIKCNKIPENKEQEVEITDNYFK
jgi:hypothetical protein